MVKQWTDEELWGIEELRRRLKDEIALAPPCPDGKCWCLRVERMQLTVLQSFLLVVGDRRIVRFLRAKQLNLDDATTLYGNFLRWRRENNVDFIRLDILYGGKTSPFQFPHGKKLIDLAPQIIITRNAMDKKGQPLGM